MPEIRLQKYCSENGLASRRKAEEYIKKGWIKVNGQVVAGPGTKIDPENDKVELCPQAKQEQQKFNYVLLNKPTGYVTNLPQNNEKEAKELLPVNFRDLNPVGRLDKDSEGLLLFTNDGVVSHRLSSPVFDHDKEYEVTVDKAISKGVLEKYRQGLVILGEKTKPVEVTKLRGTTYRFILREGKNRQIRRMLNNFNYQVLKLKRVRILNLKLGDLNTGRHRLLSNMEREKLLAVLFCPPLLC